MRWQEHQQQLRELFGALASLRDPTRRKYVIEELRGLGYPVDSERPDFDDAGGIRALLSWCLDHRGAIGALLDVLAEAEADSEPFTTAAAFVRQVLPSDHFTLKERDRLLDALGRSVPPEHLRRRFLHALKDAPGPQPADPDELLRAVETRPVPVAASTASPPLHPLLVLLEDVAADALRRRKYLRRLAGDVAQRMGQNQVQALESRRRHAEAGRRLGADLTQPSLMVQLEQDGLKHTRYRVTAWFWHDDGGRLIASRLDTTYPENTPISIEEVAAGFGQLLEEAADHTIDTERHTMTVEFILPRELLNEPVHEWLLDEDDEYSYLAADHIVIVRDLQRQRRSTSVLKWRQKWEWINLVGDVSACPGVWISCDVAPPDPGTLRLEYDRDAAVALGMTFQPELNDRRSHLATALNRGIPVAVWRRVKCDGHGAAAQAGQCAGARFRTELNQGLTDEDIHRLPRYVHEKRKEGLMHDEYWRDVILLWDDPTRIPDRLRLDAP